MAAHTTALDELVARDKELDRSFKAALAAHLTELGLPPLTGVTLKTVIALFRKRAPGNAAAIAALPLPSDGGEGAAPSAMLEAEHGTTLAALQEAALAPLGPADMPEGCVRVFVRPSADHRTLTHTHPLSFLSQL